MPEPGGNSEPTRRSPEIDKIRAAKRQLNERKSDPKLRAQTERILSMPIEDRIRQLEEEANFFLSARPVDD